MASNQNFHQMEEGQSQITVIAEVSLILYDLPSACQSETRYNMKRQEFNSEKGNYFLTLAVKFSSNIILLEVIET